MSSTVTRCGLPFQSRTSTAPGLIRLGSVIRVVGFFSRETMIRVSSRCAVDASFPYASSCSFCAILRRRRSGPKAVGGSVRNSVRQRSCKAWIEHPGNVVSSAVTASEAGLCNRHGLAPPALRHDVHACSEVASLPAPEWRPRAPAPPTSCCYCRRKRRGGVGLANPSNLTLFRASLASIRTRIS